MPRTTRRTIIAGAAAVAATLAGVLAASPAQAYPEKPLRVIVPVVAGGSTDLVARMFQQAIDKNKLLPQPITIINNGAAGGTIGTRMIKDAAPDGYTLGVWHMGLLTAAAMGVTDYDHTNFDLVAQVGTIPVGLAVRSDSKVTDMKSLIAEAKARPGQVTASMNIGLLPHFVPLMLAYETGVQFRWVQAGGGAVRLQSVLGGHTEFSLFSVPELLTFGPQGIRPIGLFSDKRDPRLPNVGTTRDEGYKTTFTEVIMWLAPKGTPKANIDVIAKALQTAMADPDMKERYEKQGIDREFLNGAQLRPVLDEKMVGIKAVAAQVKAAQPEKK